MEWEVHTSLFGSVLHDAVKHLLPSLLLSSATEVPSVL